MSIIRTKNSVLINGDNMKVLPLLRKAGMKYDCIFTDPPYGTADDSGTKTVRSGSAVNIKKFNIDWDHSIPVDWFEIALDMLVDGGSIVWWTSHDAVGDLKKLINVNAKFRNVIVWSKSNPAPTPRKNFTNGCEFAAYGTKGKTEFWYGGGTTKNVFEETICSGHERETTSHPTPKPASLVARILKVICKPNGRILDPFAGSFSTGIAATLLGMKFTGIEMNETCFNEGTERIKDAENPFGSYSIDSSGKIKSINKPDDLQGVLFS